ncbi:splicing factor 3B subunit 4-like [Symphalangus syndactylus]|uniref:splicing factor 3B subunit 4-like n=1 Tax=Symphalangus syndactylus TaxID=9590 RepID=UPI0024426704|nr:splicing factor 3B subunit 4-like [Symphalangus syndactylus]
MLNFIRHTSRVNSRGDPASSRWFHMGPLGVQRTLGRSRLFLQPVAKWRRRDQPRSHRVALQGFAPQGHALPGRAPLLPPLQRGTSAASARPPLPWRRSKPRQSRHHVAGGPGSAPSLWGPPPGLEANIHIVLFLPKGRDPDRHAQDWAGRQAPGYESRRLGLWEAGDPAGVGRQPPRPPLPLPRPLRGGQRRGAGPGQGPGSGRRLHRRGTHGAPVEPHAGRFEGSMSPWNAEGRLEKPPQSGGDGPFAGLIDILGDGGLSESRASLLAC